MKNVTHIMLKDIRALRWPLTIWGCGMTALVGMRLFTVLDKRPLGETPETSIEIVLGVLSFLLVALVVQEDSLITNTAFWRTRPFSRRSLFAAKLAMMSFVFLPVFTLVIYFSNEPRTMMEELLNVCVMLGIAAVASVTRTLLQWFLFVLLGWAGFSAAMFALFLITHGQVGPKVQRPLGLSLFDLILLFAGSISIIALAIQYAGGRRWLATGILILGYLLALAAQVTL